MKIFHQFAANSPLSKGRVSLSKVTVRLQHHATTLETSVQATDCWGQSKKAWTPSGICLLDASSCTAITKVDLAMSAMVSSHQRCAGSSHQQGGLSTFSPLAARTIRGSVSGAASLRRSSLDAAACLVSCKVLAASAETRQACRAMRRTCRVTVQNGLDLKACLH